MGGHSFRTSTGQLIRRGPSPETRKRWKEEINSKKKSEKKSSNTSKKKSRWNPFKK